MNNFKKFISGLLVCSTLFCCTPNFNMTTTFAHLELQEESNFKVSNLFSYYNPESHEDNGIIRIPVNPNDGVIRIQTLFVNPALKNCIPCLMKPNKHLKNLRFLEVFSCVFAYCNNFVTFLCIFENITCKMFRFCVKCILYRFVNFNIIKR